MADGSVVIDSKFDGDGFSRGIDNMKDKLKGFNTSLLKTSAIGSAIQLSSSIVPMLAAATAGAAGLGASFLAAGVGVGAFGAVAVTTLGEVFKASEEVAKLEEKIANADSAEERIKAQKELAKLYEGMSESQRKALTDLQEFKSFWKDFASQFEQPIFESFSTGLQIVRKLFEGLSPTIRAVADVINELMATMNQKIDAGGLKDFFEWMETNAAEALRNFAIVFGNVFAAVFNIFRAFSPLGSAMEEELVSLSESFLNWSKTIEESDGFKQFIDYVQENGPKIMELIGNLVGILIGLGEALAPLGTYALDFLTNLTGLLDALINGNPVVEGFLTGITESLPAMLEAGAQMLLSLLQGIAESMPMIIETISSLMSSIFNLIIVYLPQILEAGVQILTSLMTGLTNNMPKIMDAVVKIIDTLVNFVIQNLPKIIDSGLKLLTALVTGIINNIPKLIDTASRLITSLVQYLMNNLPKIIQTGIQILESLIKGVIQIIPRLIPLALQLIVTIVTGILSNLPQILQAGIEILMSLIEGIVNIIPSLGSAIINDVIPAILNPLQGIDLVSIGSNIISGLIGGITSMAGSLMEKASEIANNVKNTISGAMEIKSPSRWMKNFIGKNMMLGWIDGIDAMKAKVLGKVGDMTKWMSPDVGNLALSSNTGIPIIPAPFSGSKAPSNNQVISSNTETSNKNKDNHSYVVVQIGGHEAKGIIKYFSEEQKKEEVRKGRAMGLYANV